MTAEIQAGVLVRSFVIALVVLLPLWLHRRRRSHAERRTVSSCPDAVPTAEDGDPTLREPRLEDVIAGIDAVAATARTDGTATVTVPPTVTLDGSSVDAATVDALVRDALRRSGLAAIAEMDSPGGRTLECRPIDPAAR